eukprot:10891204-Alexandrium_andersonii.AAC.1
MRRPWPSDCFSPRSAWPSSLQSATAAGSAFSGASACRQHGASCADWWPSGNFQQQFIVNLFLGANIPRIQAWAAAPLARPALPRAPTGTFVSGSALPRHSQTEWHDLRTGSHRA